MASSLRATIGSFIVLALFTGCQDKLAQKSDVTPLQEDIQKLEKADKAQVAAQKFNLCPFGTFSLRSEDTDAYPTYEDKVPLRVVLTDSLFNNEDRPINPSAEEVSQKCAEIDGEFHSTKDERSGYESNWCTLNIRDLTSGDGIEKPFEWDNTLERTLPSPAVIQFRRRICGATVTKIQPVLSIEVINERNVMGTCYKPCLE